MSDRDWNIVNNAIVKAFKSGESMDALAEAFNLPRYRIERAIREQMIKESP